MHDTPCRDLNIELLNSYLLFGEHTNGTLLHRLLDMGQSPVCAALSNLSHNASINMHVDNGIIDSMKHLLYHENFIKFYSDEHVLLTLLTRAF